MTTIAKPLERPECVTGEQREWPQDINAIDKSDEPVAPLYTYAPLIVSFYLQTVAYLGQRA